jgi:histidinol dehydrogenase
LLSIDCVDECDPAKVAGVKEIIATSPIGVDGVILAPSTAGVDRIFRVGGAQPWRRLRLARTIPKVDKIVGPAIFLSPRRNAWSSVK